MLSGLRWQGPTIMGSCPPAKFWSLHTSFYTEKLLRTEPSIQRRLSTQKLLPTKFLHLQIEKPLRGVVLRRNLYTDQLFHRTAPSLTQRCFYIRNLWNLHTNAITQGKGCDWRWKIIIFPRSIYETYTLLNCSFPSLFDTLKLATDASKSQPSSDFEKELHFVREGCCGLQKVVFRGDPAAHVGTIPTALKP